MDRGVESQTTQQNIQSAVVEKQDQVQPQTQQVDAYEMYHQGSKANNSNYFMGY